MMNQLAQLASQHHNSDYSRAKFGLNGSPILYVPLSVQLPDHFSQLRSQQLVNSLRQSWWLSGAHHHRPNIQDDISDAMSEPLSQSSLPPSQPPNIPNLKTSFTHPINISAIIPTELLSLISSQALLAFPLDHTPVILEIPLPFTLPQLLNSHDLNLRSCPTSDLPFLSSPPASNLGACLQTRSSISNALQAAINSEIDSTRLGNHLNSNLASDHDLDTTVSLSVTLRVPLTKLSEANSWPANTHTLTLDNSPSPTSLGPPVMAPFHSLLSDAPASFSIGNLYLSSCPGKKVRLDGPIKGRSGVCRDLETDVKRMRELGVGCIVCCLDDTELNFLGAPWVQYELVAKQIGVDVLRLPIPEGLPPLDPSHLDGHLLDLIRRYTLQGIPVLVHCRGGVGRAGVIACAWLIRLGLCGWLTPSPSDSAIQEPSDIANVILFVQQIIATVRKRRSIKAVETYEQVNFLIDYVRYLQTQSLAQV